MLDKAPDVRPWRVGELMLGQRNDTKLGLLAFKDSW